MEFEEIEKKEKDIAVGRIIGDIYFCIGTINAKTKELASKRIIIPEILEDLIEIRGNFTSEIKQFINSISDTKYEIESTIQALRGIYILTEKDKEEIANELKKLSSEIDDFKEYAKCFFEKNFVDYRSSFDEYLPPINSYEDFTFVRDFVIGDRKVESEPMHSVCKSFVYKVYDEDKRNALFDSLERITKFLLKTNLYTPKKLDEYMVKEFKKVFGGE